MNKRIIHGNYEKEIIVYYIGEGYDFKSISKLAFELAKDIEKIME